MYEARYWGIVSAYTILHVQARFIHVACLGNKSVAVPRQDSMSPVMSGYCNIIKFVKLPVLRYLYKQVTV